MKVKITQNKLKRAKPVDSAFLKVAKKTVTVKPVIVHSRVVTNKQNRIAREFLALLHILGLRKTPYAALKFNRTAVFALRKLFKRPAPVFSFRFLAMPVLKFSAAVLVGVLISVPFMQAFEAHILNVTATPVQIDPPVLTIPGDIGWDNPNGGTDLTGSHDIIMSDADPDATHIFYSYGPGTDPNVIPDPVCGGALGGPKGDPQHLVISADTTIKAVACDGSGSGAHFSLINTKIYTFAVSCQDRFIPLDVMVIFDRSGSMLQSGKLAGAKSAAKNFVDVLNSSRDQAGLVSFSTTATLDKQLTGDMSGIKSAISGLSANGSTNIGDAIGKANSELMSVRARGNSTKLEILLTDGKANRPGTGDDNIQAVNLAKAKADEAASQGFLLYTIGLGPDVNAAFLTDLATRTGGQYFPSANVSQLADIYSQISHLLCGNGSISGYKFNDLNQNGQKDLGEPGVAGWRITLKHGNGTFATTLTDADGFYKFSDLPANVEFTLVEEFRAGWMPVNPASGMLNVTIGADGQSITNKNFANYDTGQQCTPDPINFPSGTAVLAAGKKTGDVDDVVIAANVAVNGMVRSNDDVKASGGGASRNINGDIIAGDDVENPGNFIVSGGHSILQHQSTVSLPDIHIPFWQNLAATGGTVNGSLAFPNNTPGIELGPTEIMGNLTFGSNNSAVIKGPMYIHGNLTINANTSITQDSAFGNNFAIIIVDGTISIDSNVSFAGSGTSGTFLLVSTHEATSSGTIQTSSNNSDLGRVVLFASEGNINIRSNRTVLALFAKHGWESSNSFFKKDYKHKNSNFPAINLESNVTVNYSVLPGQIACGPRVSPNQNLKQVVINEFVPNASGSDSALKPNGEWVELYNNSGALVDVKNWVLTDSMSPDTGSTQTKVWSSALNFASGNFNNTYIENSGNDRVRVNNTFTSGSYEQVFDAGASAKAQWQNISWNESLSAGADICVQAATSNDGISYAPYSVPDCSSPFGLGALPDSRFIKWKTTHSRTTGLTTNNADLLDLTLSYKPITYNELVITNSNTNTGGTEIPAGGFLVVYRNGNANFDLDNSSGSVNLYNGHPMLGASQIDSHIYNFPGGAPEGKSFTRMPDGTANWIDPEATPGQPNDAFLNSNTDPAEQVVYSDVQPEPEPEIMPPQEGESDYIDPNKVDDKPVDDSSNLTESSATTTTSTLESLPETVPTAAGETPESSSASSTEPSQSASSTGAVLPDANLSTTTETSVNNGNQETSPAAEQQAAQVPEAVVPDTSENKAPADSSAHIDPLPPAAIEPQAPSPSPPSLEEVPAN